MKTITEHQINECNSAIELLADDPDPNNGNASHRYAIKVGPGIVNEIHFQHGPIKEVGTNGLTHEVLIAILIDRLRGFQTSQYACPENAAALSFLERAQTALHERTKARVARGVEGTHEV